MNGKYRRASYPQRRNIISEMANIKLALLDLASKCPLHPQHLLMRLFGGSVSIARPAIIGWVVTQGYYDVVSLSQLGEQTGSIRANPREGHGQRSDVKSDSHH